MCQVLGEQSQPGGLPFGSLSTSLDLGPAVTHVPNGPGIMQREPERPYVPTPTPPSKPGQKSSYGRQGSPDFRAAGLPRWLQHPLGRLPYSGASFPRLNISTFPPPQSSWVFRASSVVQWKVYPDSPPDRVRLEPQLFYKLVSV